MPFGKISVVAGQMGQAKSLFTAWLAAWTTPSGVVMLSAEDDPADTVRPRLEAVGADLERVEIASDVTLDVERLRTLCDELGDVKLITVDPIQAYLPASVNSWKGQDVRIALEPVRQFAAERSIAVLLVQHLNRRTDGDPLVRIADSQGVPQLARSVMIWGPDPADPAGDHGDRKVLTRVKGNLARSSSTSATLDEQGCAYVTGDVLFGDGDDQHITPDDVIADSETRTARETKPPNGYERSSPTDPSPPRKSNAKHAKSVSATAHCDEQRQPPTSSANNSEATTRSAHGSGAYPTQITIHIPMDM